MRPYLNEPDLTRDGVTVPLAHIRLRTAAWCGSFALLAAGLLLPGGRRAAAQEIESPARRRALEAPLPSPEVEALLQTNPTTPPECFQAARILAELDRPELAKQFLTKVLEVKLNRTQLAEMADRFGSRAFLGLAARPELNPEAEQLAEAVVAAAQEARQDTGRIEQLISGLQAPSPAERQRAMLGLVEAGGAAIGPMVRVLADPQRAEEHTAVRRALVALEGTAVEPLLGVLEGGGPDLTAQAVRILAALEAERALPRLLGIAFDPQVDPELRVLAQAAVEHIAGRRPAPNDAVRLLAKRARDYFEHNQPVMGVVEGRVERWHWDPEQNTLAPREFTEDDARRRLAARLARDAHAIDPDNHALQVLRLATMLEQAAFEQGLGNPLPIEEGTAAARALQTGPVVLEEVMQEAIRVGRPAAAAAAASLLSKAETVGRGPEPAPPEADPDAPPPDPAYEAAPDAVAGEPEPAGKSSDGPDRTDVLLHQGAEASPLVRAAIHADRRVRMAALESIVALQPTRPFAGSHHVPQSLAFMASTGGGPKALLAGPKRDQMLRLAGFLAARGIGVDTATNGREMLRLAAASPDYVLVLVDSRLDNPTIDLALQKLRYDYRSADLRVGVLARAEEYDRAEHLVRNDPAALWFAWPHDEETFGWQFDQLMAIESDHFVGPDERRQMASRAMDLILEISRPEQRLYDMRLLDDVALSALYVPDLAERATLLASRLGTPEAQRALVGLAGRETAPLDLRQAAVAAFGRSIEQHGILLTTEEILHQYDRYNASGMRDVGTRQVMAQVLDYIEAPTRPDAPEED